MITVRGFFLIYSFAYNDFCFKFLLSNNDIAIISLKNINLPVSLSMSKKKITLNIIKYLCNILGLGCQMKELLSLCSSQLKNYVQNEIIIEYVV